MPSHYAHSALVEMFLECKGAPWTYARWREITKCHGGLFPEDGAPASHNWTASQTEDVRTYFHRYSKHIEARDLQARLSFSLTSGQKAPGAELWRQFVINGWKSWKIHDRITRVLIQKRLHPCILASYSKTPDVLPDSAYYIPRAVDAVGHELFGEEALDGLGNLSAELIPMAKAIIQRTWISICIKAGNAKKKMGALEQEAQRAFEGKPVPYVCQTSLTEPTHRLGARRGIEEGRHSNRHYTSLAVESRMRRHTIAHRRTEDSKTGICP
jgi:TATA-binding protein-associated factor